MTINVIEQKDVLNEVVMSIRNDDVLPKNIRNVETETSLGSLVDEDVIIIEKGNVKNIRSVEVGGVEVKPLNINLDANGECVITLPQNYTDDYEVEYDYGSDRIFSGYARQDLTLNSFPRIAVEYISIDSNPGGFGNVNRNRHDISIVVYSDNKEQIREVITAVRKWCVKNQNVLNTLRLIKPVMVGPIVIAGEFVRFKDKMFKQNFDFAGLLSYEVNN